MSTIVITGVSRGLGKALFELCIEQGHRVYGIIRSEAAYSQLSETLPDSATLILADVSSDSSIESLKQLVTEPVDLLINNAGIPGRTPKLGDVAPDEVLELVNVHCLGALRTVKVLREQLLAGPAPMVININSRLGSIGAQAEGKFDHLMVSYSYRIAKAAQNMLTVCLHKEFGDRIRFVSLHPGLIRTSIAQVDAMIEPRDSATQILDFWKTGGTHSPAGIVALPDSLIEW